MVSFETDPPPAHPTVQSRRRSAVFIAVVVVLQFILPLTYLTREDSSDDRFTWRSFGAPETPACESQARMLRVDGSDETLPLQALLHEDWVHHVQRGRRAVVDAFLLKQCEAPGVEQVEIVNRCGDPSETRSFALRCSVGLAHETTRTAAR